MVEVAQSAVKSDPFWKHRFNARQRRMHRNPVRATSPSGRDGQAIVAIARQLLELVWHVLHRIQLYRHFSYERIACKFLTCSWQLSDADRDGLTRQQFTRYYLMRLGVGHDLQRIVLDPKRALRLAIEAELLALRLELLLNE